MIEVRRAKPEDLESYKGRLLSVRSYSWVAEMDGEIVAVGGYGILPQGMAIIYLDAKNDIQRDHPLRLARMAMAVIRDARERGFRTIIAECDEKIEGADKFLEWLGFSHTGAIYVYEG